MTERAIPRKAVGIPTALDRAIEWIRDRKWLGITIERVEGSSKWTITAERDGREETATKPNRRSALAHLAEIAYYDGDNIWEDFRTAVNWHGEPPTTWSPTTKEYVEVGPYWEARALYRLSLKETSGEATRRRLRSKRHPADQG